MEYGRALDILLKSMEIGNDRHFEVSAAVADASGNPVLTARGKETDWHGRYMATGKARLAAAFRKSTDVLKEHWKDRPMFPMSLTEASPGGVTLNAGGYSTFDGVDCVGAIGIGGNRKLDFINHKPIRGVGTCPVVLWMGSA